MIMATSGIPQGLWPVEWLWYFNRSLTITTNPIPLLTFYTNLAIICASKRGTNLPIEAIPKGYVMAIPKGHTMIELRKNGKTVNVPKAFVVYMLLRGYNIIPQKDNK
jgi:hypothetical protein